MNVVRVQIIAGHRLMADSLAHRLAHENDLLVLPHRSPEELLNGPPGPRADTAIIDASSTSEIWPRLVELLAGANDTRVVLLSDVDDAGEALVAARQGVGAWLPSRTRAHEIADAIRAVAAGHTLYPSDLLGPVLDGLREDVRLASSARVDDGPLADLTEREREVLGCLIDGAQSGEIARELDMAPNTVRTHTNRIFRKLGAHSRLEAVRIARHAGLIPRSDSHPSGRGPSSINLSSRTDER